MDQYDADGVTLGATQRASERINGIKERSCAPFVTPPAERQGGGFFRLLEGDSSSVPNQRMEPGGQLV